MPSVNDYDPNDPDGSGSSDGAGGGLSSSGGGQLFGGASKQHEQAFTPWSRFASANSEVSDREAGKLKSQVGGDVDSAMNALDKANRAYGKQVNANYTNPNTDRETRGDPNDLYGAPSAAAVGAGNAFRSTAFGQPAPAWGALTGGKPGANPGSQTQAPGRAPTGVNKTVGTTPPATGVSEVGGKVSELNANAVANGPQGPKDLQSSMSPDAWAGLTGQISKANEEASALGKESGVQALLSQNSGAPATGFDAALVGGSGQQQGFGQTARQFGNFALPQQLLNSEQGSQDAWSRMTDQAAQGRAAEKQRAANAQRDADNARGVVDLQQPAAPVAAGPTAPSFDDLTKNDTTHTATWDDVGRAGATNNISKISDWTGLTSGGKDGPGGPGQDAWQLVRDQFLKGSGLSDADQSRYWDDFRNSLPEGMRNYVNALVANNGIGADYFKNNHKSSDADWQWFQQLFSAYMKKNPPSGGAQQESGGLESESTKPAQ